MEKNRNPVWSLKSPGLLLTGPLLKVAILSKKTKKYLKKHSKKSIQEFKKKIETKKQKNTITKKMKSFFSKKSLK